MIFNRSIVSLILASISIVTIAFAQDVRPPGSQPFLIPFPRGEPGSLMDRWFEFDRKLDYWRFNLAFPSNLDRDTLETLRDFLSDRSKQRQGNSRPLGVMRRIHLEPEDQQIPPRILDRMFGELPPILPDVSAQERLLAEYTKAETAAEESLARRVTRILTPDQQFEFLAKAANLDLFLIHPLGDAYLQLTRSQKAGLEKQYQVRKELTDKRLKSPAHLKAIAQAENRISAGDTRINITVTAETNEEFRARMQLFAILSKEQLEAFLRLNRSIKPDQQLVDWINNLKSEKKAIAEVVLMPLVN